VREVQEWIDLVRQSFQCVEELCYLEDIISTGGGAGESSVTRVRSGWKKFRELLQLLTLRGLSLQTKGYFYAACVRSVMLYGSETWPVKNEDIRRLRHTEMRMARWMCGASTYVYSPSSLARFHYHRALHFLHKLHSSKGKPPQCQ